MNVSNVDYDIERTGLDRRGQKPKKWTQAYWKRYYVDNPEKDRRTGEDRRKADNSSRE